MRGEGATASISPSGLLFLEAREVLCGFFGLLQQILTKKVEKNDKNMRIIRLKFEGGLLPTLTLLTPC